MRGWSHLGSDHPHVRYGLNPSACGQLTSLAVSHIAAISAKSNLHAKSGHRADPPMRMIFEPRFVDAPPKSILGEEPRQESIHERFTDGRGMLAAHAFPKFDADPIGAGRCDAECLSFRSRNPLVEI